MFLNDMTTEYVFSNSTCTPQSSFTNTVLRFIRQWFCWFLYWEHMMRTGGGIRFLLHKNIQFKKQFVHWNWITVCWLWAFYIIDFFFTVSIHQMWRACLWIHLWNLSTREHCYPLEAAHTVQEQRIKKHVCVICRDCHTLSLQGPARPSVYQRMFYIRAAALL